MEGGGKTFKLNDSKDLSKKIIELLLDQKKLETLREKALGEVKKYDWTYVAEIYISHFKELSQK